EGPLGLLHIPTAFLAGWIRTVARLAAASPLMIRPGPAALGALVATIVWWRRSVPAGARPPGRDVR
ncbi:MAG TPA: hypothetical protein VJS45_05850, partial [Acidimicrobiia bacterium]|nr:hypothetical protein [Acidimicrobiia bacterium]